MERLERLINILAGFKDDVCRHLEEATREAEETIIGMNVSQLYDGGENANGEKIKPEYAPATVQIKRKKGQPTDRVTLRDTFAWQSSFYIQYGQDGFEIMAGDWKTGILKEKYGGSILGLQDGNVRYLCDNYYKPKLMQELRRALYGN